jgi:hypothetical protein
MRRPRRFDYEVECITAALASRTGQSVRVAVVSYERVVDLLRSEVPEFAPEIDEHLEDSGEALPHVLFGDFSRFVVAARVAGDAPLVDRCLAFLEEALNDGDAQVRNLVQVSFVENVGPWDGDAATFIETWPPNLRKEAERQRDWKPGDPGPASAWGHA